MNAIPWTRRNFIARTFSSGVGVLALRDIRADSSTQSNRTIAGPGTTPALERASAIDSQLSGWIGTWLIHVTDNWLKTAPESNPAMLEMFRDRDRQPLREMVPWAGEFAGKYLTAAVQVWRLTRDASLKKEIDEFVKRLVPLQDEDGYLGPWPRSSRLTGQAPNAGAKGGPTWDAWGHYHVMIGLLLYAEDQRTKAGAAALNCAIKIGDLFCRKFESARLVDTGSSEMNLAPAHSLALLFRRTGNVKYLRQSLRMVDEFGAKSDGGQPLAGDYLNAALAGKEFFQMPKPRWESLHPIMAMSELFWVTGDERYRRAFEQIWWSIAKLDRHNNGGFSSGEQAQGNPYHQGAIETCCTIAWVALGVEMLRLTGNPIVADELELSTLNSVTGLHAPNGRWCTYNTPMDGVRKASAHDIVFQARAGSPELNCCSVNGARGFGLISEWAVMRDGEGVVLNWYGASSFKVRLPESGTVTLQQRTEYPRQNRVTLSVEPNVPARFTLKLRIPHWSRTTEVALNGDRLDGLRPGEYLRIHREWSAGDRIEIAFDFSMRAWAGEKECAGKGSLYRGPILLTWDRRFNDMDPGDIPVLKAAELSGEMVSSSEWLPPELLVEFRVGGNRSVRLCDFASAGVGGSPYLSWLRMEGIEAAEFSKQNPLRSHPLSRQTAGER